MISQEEKDAKERLSTIVKNKGFKFTDLSDTKSGQVMVARQLDPTKETPVPYRTIHKILHMAHEYSADWVILGEGSMYKADHVAPHIYTQHNEVKGNTAGGDINVGPDTVVTKKTVDTMQARIDELVARITELETDKRNMQLLIDSLTVKPRK